MVRIEKYTDFEDILEKKYCEENYRVVETGAKTGRCIICFSSNGVYFPDTREEVIRRLIEQDRYEWTNIMADRCLQQYFEKVIFVRDIYKQWYVNGINSKVDSIEKMIQLLQKLTVGYEIYTCGNSAGGYAAVITGILLEAKRVYSFSGYFSLMEIMNDSAYVKEGRKYYEKFQYYDLRPFLEKTECEIFYFYPGKSDIDIQQANYIQDYSCVHPFCMKQKLHGASVWDVSYKYIFTMETEDLFGLKKDKGMLSPAELELRTAGCRGVRIDLINWLRYKEKRVLSRIKMKEK